MLLVYQAVSYLQHAGNGIVFAAVNCCGTSPELTSNTAKLAHGHYGHRPAAFQLGRILTPLVASRIDHEIHEHRRS